MMDKINVGIIGASGYGAGELLRLLATHPHVNIVAAVTSSAAGVSLGDLHPNLSGDIATLKCSSDLDRALFSDSKQPCCIFTALPHGLSGSLALSLHRDEKLAALRVIDLSGDLRLKNHELAQSWYPETEFVQSERNAIVYGLAEINHRKIKSARLIANPGCLASAAILGLAPLMSSTFSASIVIDAKTGTSGAGRTPQEAFHHPSMHANCNSYKVLEHRHEPEIREILGDPFATRIETAFVPTVIPTSRGIYASCYVTSDQLPDEETLFTMYKDFYKSALFVQVSSKIPELRSVIGSNRCLISLKKRGRMLFVAVALDNLIKGMAGSAIQNMNIACGLNEELGLTTSGLGII
jgi:N-acetyl-gamma-glutamyl-phosphate reductase